MEEFVNLNWPVITAFSNFFGVVWSENTLRFQSEMPKSTLSFIYKFCMWTWSWTSRSESNLKTSGFYVNCRMLGNVAFLSSADFPSLLALRFLANYLHWITAMSCILLKFHSIMRRNSKCSFHCDRDYYVSRWRLEIKELNNWKQNSQRRNNNTQNATTR